MQADGRAVMATMMAGGNNAWMVNFAQVGKESSNHRPAMLDKAFGQTRFARKSQFSEPDQADLGCPVPLEKIFLFFRITNQAI
jgi:hypothetical protein